MPTELLEPTIPLADSERNPDSLYEVIDGVDVELPPMSMESVYLANELSWSLNSFARAAGLGRASTEILIQLNLKTEKRDRRPDLIYVSYRKWPQGTPLVQDNAWDIVPDICVEVVSPNDKIEDLEEKIDEYFEAGVPQVWVVRPASKRIRVYHSPTDETTLTVRDKLIAGEILPGYELDLEKFFAV